ncbi:hypothetical protein Amet_3472 [Alkaliphilus metalliredigens QYMF]|uniref:Uncharacterized protein n=1 Tax=Alkaliphilus metalliredigens (strain QYMF) TaxID=293826 RepID=A6TTT2_ALKMQ|nr:hypothetical protein [Alkaliphilus metalliredigens]ABR49600.1 hypothetical protein Amet_3472 [Alkaliphilus metalliredigens QYMF]
MILNKREKILAFLLMGTVLLGSYYKFLIVPQVEALGQLRIDKELKQQGYITMNQSFQSEINIDEDFKNLNSDFLDIAKNYFGELEQEDTILILNEFLLYETIKIPEINFTQPRNEIIQGEEDNENTYLDSASIEVTSIQFNYQTNYEGLISFLKEIGEYDKKIIVNSLNITNDMNGLLSGNMTIDFYAVPQVSKYFPKKPSVLTYFSTDDIEAENQPNPFDGFYLIERESEEVYLEYDEYNDSWKKDTIYGFEAQNTFFVGNPRDIIGSVSQNTNSMEGRYATKLEYDFIRSREYSVANLVFEGEPITIDRQPETFGLWAYSFETNNHSIGAVLIDSKGREFKVSLVNNVDWTGWNNIEVSLPIEITYPATVQRLYVESTGFSDKSKGHFLFDKLEVLYRDILPFSN